MIARLWAAMLAAAPARTWFLFGAALSFSLQVVGLVLIIWLGLWSPAREAQRLSILGQIALTLLGLQIVIIVAMAMVRFKAAGPGGLALEIEGEGQP